MDNYNNPIHTWLLTTQIISIIPPGKEPQKANVLAEGRGNFEGMMEEDTYIIYVISYRSENYL